MSQYLTTRRIGQTQWVELKNPPVNFLTTDILTELHQVVSAADRDDTLRVLVLTGGIEDHYIFHFSIPEILRISTNAQRLKLSAIASLPVLSQLLTITTALVFAAMRGSRLIERGILKLTSALSGAIPAIHMLLQMHATYAAIERSRKVTIAAINGSCNGGGTEMAACFDFRFMVGDANFVIGQPEVLIGIVAGGGGTQRVSRLVGKAKALEYMLTGDLWTPEQARQAGLITNHFPKASFHEAVQTFADRLATRSPISYGETRRAVQSALDLGLSWGLAVEMSASLRCLHATTTSAAIKEYIDILAEQIDAHPDQPAKVQDIFKIVESTRLTRHFTDPITP